MTVHVGLEEDWPKGEGYQKVVFCRLAPSTKVSPASWCRAIPVFPRCVICINVPKSRTKNEMAEDLHSLNTWRSGQDRRARRHRPAPLTLCREDLPVRPSPIIAGKVKLSQCLPTGWGKDPQNPWDAGDPNADDSGQWALRYYPT